MPAKVGCAYRLFDLSISTHTLIPTHIVWPTS